jgi:hypothetical protein
MICLLSLPVVFLAGFLSCWVWKANTYRKTQSDMDAMKASAANSERRSHF